MDDQKAMPSDPLPPPPAAIRRAVLVTSLVLGASSLAGLGLAVVGTSSVVLGLLGFELVVFVAAVLAVLAGFGRFRNGYGLALACVAGTVVGATLLGYVDGKPNFVSNPDMARLLKANVLARAGLAGAMGALGAAAVLNRDRRSWGVLVKGLVVVSPVVVIGGLTVVFARDWLTSPRDGAGEAVRIGSIVLGVMVLGGFFCAGAHLIIRAFQTCDFERLSENEGA